MNPKLTKLFLAVSFASLFFLFGCAKKEKQLEAHMETSMGTMVFKLYESQTPKTVENFVGLANGTLPKQETSTDSKKTEIPEPKPFYDGLTFHRVIHDFMIQGGCPQGTGTGGPGYQFEDECFVNGAELTGEILDEEVAKNVFQTAIYPHLAKNRGVSPNEMIADLFAEMQQNQSFTPLIGKQVEDIKAAVLYEEAIYSRTLIAPVAYGTLCMANSGPNTNGSQFFITTKKEGCEWLNGKHTVFGEIISGLDVLEKMQEVEVDGRDKPVEPVTILNITIKENWIKVSS